MKEREGRRVNVKKDTTWRTSGRFFRPSERGLRWVFQSFTQKSEMERIQWRKKKKKRGSGVWRDSTKIYKDERIRGSDPQARGRDEEATKKMEDLKEETFKLTKVQRTPPPPPRNNAIKDGKNAHEINYNGKRDVWDGDKRWNEKKKYGINYNNGLSSKDREWSAGWEEIIERHEIEKIGNDQQNGKKI